MTDLTLVPDTLVCLQVNSQVTFRRGLEVALRTGILSPLVNVFYVLLPVRAAAGNVVALRTREPVPRVRGLLVSQEFRGTRKLQLTSPARELFYLVILVIFIVTSAGLDSRISILCPLLAVFHHIVVHVSVIVSIVNFVPLVISEQFDVNSLAQAGASLLSCTSTDCSSYGISRF